MAYNEWQNPTGYVKDEETGIYRWIDPVTNKVVKSTYKPILQEPVPGSTNISPAQTPPIQNPNLIQEREPTQTFSGDLTPIATGFNNLAKIKEEQETAAFFLYGIAKKNAELMATAMPTIEGGKLMVPDPVLIEMAAQGYAENKRQIDLWYKSGKMQIEGINDSKILNTDEQYKTIDETLLQLSSKRPIIIPQSTTLPSAQNIRMETPQEQPKSIYTPEEQKQIETAVQSGNLDTAAVIQEVAQKREKRLKPTKELETQINNAIKIGDYITAAKLKRKSRPTTSVVTGWPALGGQFGGGLSHTYNNPRFDIIEVKDPNGREATIVKSEWLKKRTQALKEGWVEL